MGQQGLEDPGVLDIENIEDPDVLDIEKLKMTHSENEDVNNLA